MNNWIEVKGIIERKKTMGSMKASIRVVLMVALLALALPLLVNSGTVMKMKVHTDAMEMMGQKTPAQDVIITSYYSG